MTQPVIQKCNENSYRSMPAKLYIQIASSWLKPGQVVQLNRRNPADHHSSYADCGLGIRARARSSVAPYLHFAQLQSKSTSEKEKHGKNIVSVMENVLLILFC